MAPQCYQCYERSEIIAADYLAFSPGFQRPCTRRNRLAPPSRLLDTADAPLKSSKINQGETGGANFDHRTLPRDEPPTPSLRVLIIVNNAAARRRVRGASEKVVGR